MAHIITRLNNYSGSDVSSLAKTIKSYPMEELIKSKMFYIQDDGTWTPVIVQSDENLEIECSWQDIPEGTRIYLFLFDSVLEGTIIIPNCTEASL